ncbi:PepSY domain-containing protein [Sphingomonas sabuli]|uniref:PepSY domain-containing protein n=1 Tax=Sphingomonas sabuli TaxID=2764186 RepID=A0A7G9L1R7_9SPHN|nr:PepSY domain-containing protein [Sphingomonas sabuli]QNM82566.1 PepSY domain-containing protein [Sphingomonas sabuli]
MRSQLRRWHIWLGWIVGLPFLFWVISGLVMVARPIDEVRGTGLLKDLGPVRMERPPVVPRIDGVPLQSLTLKASSSGPRWVATLPDGKVRIADPATGAWLPEVSATAAAHEITSRYGGKAGIAGVSRTAADDPPLDLRREIPAWQVRMTDGTNFYVDARTGEVVATRTRFWRFYDWMWGLHIMDLKTREDTHNPLIIGFAIVALVTTVLALVMLPLTIRRRRRRSA